MIVGLNDESFSYDVHSLIKAFYPEEDVKIVGAPLTEDENDSDNKEIYDSAEIIVNVDYSNICDDCYDGRVIVSLCNDKSEACDFDGLKRPDVKNTVKRVIYKALSQHLNRELVWGTLTGIRPTKIPMKMICEEKSDSQIADYIKSTYLASDEKITLATEIAHREKAIIDSVDSKNGFSLYAGIPFCPTRCMYCSFTSYPIGVYQNRVENYLEALKSELKYLAEVYKGRCPDSVYIGGGTPTTLEAGQLTDLIKFIKDEFDFSKVKEFTVEAGRPDSVTVEKLTALLEGGVTRISINPQTMNDKTLKIIGRNHTVSQFEDAFKLARSVGFDNINTDLILGLPGEVEDDVKYTFDNIAKLAPDSLTVHSMAIKRAANMHRFLTEHEDIVSRNTPEMMDMAEKCAKDLGLLPYYLYRQKNMAGNYENVGYAKEGKFGLYNILIMEEIEDIAAAGAGTISKRVFNDGRIERCDDVKDVDLYIRDIARMIEKKHDFYGLE